MCSHIYTHFSTDVPIKSDFLWYFQVYHPRLVWNHSQSGSSSDHYKLIITRGPAYSDKLAAACFVWRFIDIYRLKPVACRRLITFHWNHSMQRTKRTRSASEVQRVPTGNHASNAFHLLIARREWLVSIALCVVCYWLLFFLYNTLRGGSLRFMTFISMVWLFCYFFFVKYVIFILASCWKETCGQQWNVLRKLK